MFLETIYCIFYYVFMVIIVRFLGKREIGQLGVLDLVIFLIIADISAIGVQKHDFKPALAIFSIALIEKILSYVLLKIEAIRTIVEGQERIIIMDGKIDFKAMKKELFTIDDLMTKLRLLNKTDIKSIALGILESNGDLTVVMDGEMIPLPIIKNNKIVIKNLPYIKKTKEEIENIKPLKDIKLAFYYQNKLMCFDNTFKKYESQGSIK